VKYWHFSGIVTVVLLLNGCGRPAIQVLEVDRKTISSEETIRMNNCGGKDITEQAVQRTFATGLDVNSQNQINYAGLEDLVAGKYGVDRDATKSQLLKAPPGTNMEFVLQWREDMRSGNVFAGDRIASYEVHIPVAVELVSSRDLLCDAIVTDDKTQSNGHIQEIVTVSFKDGASGVWTENEYAEKVTFLVQGTGKASGAQQSDAFYVFTDFNGEIIEPMRYTEFYNFTLWVNGEPADTLVDPIPPYNPYHVYQVTINAPGGRLVFAVGDVYTIDNDGYYTIVILK